MNLEGQNLNIGQAERRLRNLQQRQRQAQRAVERQDKEAIRVQGSLVTDSFREIQREVDERRMNGKRIPKALASRYDAAVDAMTSNLGLQGL